MASYEKIVGLSQALYEATAEVSRLSGEVSNLKYIKNKLKKKSTEIDYVVTLKISWVRNTMTKKIRKKKI